MYDEAIRNVFADQMACAFIVELLLTDFVRGLPPEGRYEYLELLRQTLRRARRTKDEDWLEPITVLFSSLDQPWSAWGLQTSMQRAKAGAKITNLRLRDLRGSAVTNLVRAGLTLEDVATIVASERARVEAIAMR